MITATAIAATVTDPAQFRSGRQVAASCGTHAFSVMLGLTPQPPSTGGKTRLGCIFKQGDRYLRRLLAVGATAVMRHAKKNQPPMTDWVNGLLEKKAIPARLPRACQYTRPHRLGYPDERRSLPPIRAARLNGT
ncbi:MAG: IS110 family transposase [Cypionkella sp.]|nr:IS110 family transposase [Cypionkella sp.]